MSGIFDVAQKFFISLIRNLSFVPALRNGDELHDE